MRALALLAALALTSCGAVPTGPALVSTQYPPGTGLVNVNSPLQTVNSLPPGAANFSTAPGATAPDFGSLAVSVF